MIAFVSPFTILNGTLASTNVYDKIVRAQLIDALTTNQGERVMHPTWGCNVLAMLFDPSSSLERQDTAAYVRDQLIQMVPRVIVQSVEVNVDDVEPNVVYIDIRYKTSNFSPSATVAVSLNTTGVGA